MPVQATALRNITNQQSRASRRLGSDELSKPGGWKRPRNEQPASDSHARPHTATASKAGHTSIRSMAQSSVRAATSLLNTVSAQSIYIDHQVHLYMPTPRESSLLLLNGRVPEQVPYRASNSSASGSRLSVKCQNVCRMVARHIVAGRARQGSEVCMPACTGGERSWRRGSFG